MSCGAERVKFLTSMPGYHPPFRRYGEVLVTMNLTFFMDSPLAANFRLEIFFISSLLDFIYKMLFNT